MYEIFKAFRIKSTNLGKNTTYQQKDTKKDSNVYTENVKKVIWCLNVIVFIDQTVNQALIICINLVNFALHFKKPQSSKYDINYIIGRLESKGRG